MSELRQTVKGLANFRTRCIDVIQLQLSSFCTWCLG